METYVILGCPQGSRLVRPCGAHGGVHVSPHSVGPRGGLLEAKLVPAGHMDMSMCHLILWALLDLCLFAVCQLRFASWGAMPEQDVNVVLCLWGPWALGGPCVPLHAVKISEKFNVVDLGSSRN